MWFLVAWRSTPGGASGAGALATVQLSVVARSQTAVLDRTGWAWKQPPAAVERWARVAVMGGAVAVPRTLLRKESADAPRAVALRDDSGVAAARVLAVVVASGTGVLGLEHKCDLRSSYAESGLVQSGRRCDRANSTLNSPAPRTWSECFCKNGMMNASTNSVHSTIH